ncbi:MAG: LamG-like jellyroll fold domain-containing protein [Planctomycetia bacterium]|nr:LamG-like jellyroll fold domain-containing protein [Planctomycetia bacterium]
MSDSNRISPLLLVDKYIQGTLTDPQAALLLNEVKRNPQLLRFLKRNLIAHAWLEEKFRARLAAVELLDSSPAPATTSASKPVIDRIIPPTHSDDFTHALNADRETKPIVCPITYHPEEPSFWRRLFGVGRETSTAKKRSRFLLAVTHPMTRMALIIVGAIVTGLVVWHVIASSLKNTQLRPELLASAQVLELIDVEYVEGQTTLRRGQLINAGNIAIDSGLVKLRFKNQAELVLEGPADLSIRDELTVFCNRGRASVHVPKSTHGFTLATPFAEVVDRGTRFFAEVGDKGIDVHTIEGAIEFKTSNAVETLLAGMSSAFDGLNMRPPRNNFQEDYYNSSRFESHLKSYVARQKEEKQKAETLQNTTTNVLVRFDTANRQKETIINSAPGREADSPLTIRSCGKTEGFIHGTEAIDFKTGDSAAFFELPGEYETLTLTSTMKLDAWNEQGCVIFSSEDFPKQPGSFLWQIQNSGKIALFVADGAGKSELITSQRCLSTRDLGGWFTLKIIINGQNNSVSFFIDNKFVSRKKWDTPLPLTIGRGSLGNASGAKLNHSRYFSGAIDTFTIIDGSKDK